jgi:hypothetical protein
MIMCIAGTAGRFQITGLQRSVSKAVVDGRCLSAEAGKQH